MIWRVRRPRKALLVTSERKVRTNRTNARRSTGPRSAVGKARAAQNARRHGLSQDVLADPSLAAEVDRLADALARLAKPLDLRDLARRVAEAEVDFSRVRRYRLQRMAEAMKLTMSENATTPPEVLERALVSLVKELKRVDRYERRALSRRKFAIRDFAKARQQGLSGIASWSVLRPPRRRPPRRLPPPTEPVCVSGYDYLFRWLRAESRALTEQLAVAEARADARAAAQALPPLSNEEKVERMLAQLDAENGGTAWRKGPIDGK
jgi:hypothetical protein